MFREKFIQILNLKEIWWWVTQGLSADHLRSHNAQCHYDHLTKLSFVYWRGEGLIWYGVYPHDIEGSWQSEFVQGRAKRIK